MVRLLRVHIFWSLAIVLLCIEVVPAGASPKFKNLSVASGLSHNSVWCIFQDNQGFFWFGTDDGVSKYDGYNFTVYRHHKYDSTSLSHNVVRALLQDRSGMIWIGTSDGLNVFDPVTERFHVYRTIPGDSSSISSNEISAIAEDRSGSIWVGTHTHGINKFLPHSKTFQRFANDPANERSLSSNYITSMYFDKANVLWIGTQIGGVNRYDAASGTFTHFRELKRDGRRYSEVVYSFCEDSKGRFWVGTFSSGISMLDRKTGAWKFYYQGVPSKSELMDSLTVLTIDEDKSGKIIYGTFGGGLQFLDPETGETTAWRHDVQDPASLADNRVLKFYIDPMGNEWIGTYASGVSMYDPRAEHFQTYRNEYPHPTLFSDNNIRSLYRDERGSIWVGTSKGLNILDVKTGTCERYFNRPGDPSSLSDNYVNAIMEDSKGTFWIGTRKGFNRFDRKTKRFTQYLEDTKNPHGLNNSSIRTIVEDREGTIWIGTMDGLNEFDSHTNRFKHFQNDPANPRSISCNNVRSIYQDRSGTLWIGTYGGGIDKFDRASGTFKQYVHDSKDTNSISHNYASPIIEDLRGNLWIGTYGGGLNRLDPRTDKFTVFTETDGLINNTIFGIQSDAKGNLWITTNSGICCFDPETKEYHNYTSAAGLQGEEFNLGSSFKDEDGTMLFGGNNGFNMFQPDKIQENYVLPPVYITSMSIFSKPVQFDTALTMKKHIVLSYDENSVSFDFVALNYRRPDLNHYRYMLEGFDKEWSPIVTLRKASYTNLPPGKFVFRVQGSNNDKVWNTVGASLSIVIKPPFWRTWWAYLLYVICISGLFTGSLQIAQRRQRRKLIHEQQRHEAELVRQKNIKLKEANDEILRHQEIVRERSNQIESTNRELKEEIVERHRAEDLLKEALDEKEVLLKEIHHRVKNNLNVVASLLSLQSDLVVNPKDRELLHEAKNRVVTMARIHEKLYQSKNLADIEFGDYIRGVATQLFHAYNYGNASLQISAEKIKFGVDTAIPCGLIINELISNSLKYAFPDGAHGMVFIEVRMSSNQEYEVIVGDTGIGFPASIDFRSTDTMGMTLITTLVRQLRGTIELESVNGTKFIIRFPLGKE
jgi:two-component sensor histidine kinase/ligand-binding sensor domain-containing protein